ncbi:hypothetical protein IFM89_012639 [Coptis chinensis]|uniref:SET domain-containing protein n=1 Tax=Coptis chinensis TaxID=261450 RepID=A0A835IQI1_9MAGN|nr:hypothetical protein IFM89_012639 [Coptis chinensis]
MADTSKQMLEIREIEGRGRGVVANRSIKAGEVLLKESPILVYSAKPLKSDLCSNCFRKLNLSSSVLSCASCSSQTFFCSPSCQSTAMTSSHTPWACQALKAIGSLALDDSSDAHFLIAAYNMSLVSPSHFQILLSLEGSMPTDTLPDQRTISLHSLILSLSPPQSFAGFSFDLTAALLAKDKRNAFALMEPFQEDGERNVRAYAIYPNASFFNHDCLPNAARFDYLESDVSDHNTDIIIRAIHDFPQGREICLSYFPVNWNYADRQRRLVEDYGFTCDCDRCKVEVSWKEDGDDNDDNMEENEEEQMVGSEDEYSGAQGEADFPHAYFFVRYVCDRDNCGGTLAPLPPSEGSPSDVIECNVCGQLRTEDDVDGTEGEDGVMVDQ